MKIIYKNGTDEIVEKKSRFIANVFKVESEEQAVDIINNMKKKILGCKTQLLRIYNRK